MFLLRINENNPCLIILLICICSVVANDKAIILRENIAYPVFFAILVCVLALHCYFKIRQRREDRKKRNQIDGRIPHVERIMVEQRILDLRGMYQQ